MSESRNVGIVGYGFATKTFHAPLIAGLAAYAKFKQGSQLFASSLQELRDDVERLQS